MKDTIAEIARKYKGTLQEWILPAVVVLVGLTSFGLGRLSAMEGESHRLVIRMPDGTIEALSSGSAQTAAVAQAAPAQGRYVASKTGSKFYLPSCAGAERIREENKVWFATIADAKAAGYAPAAACPGL